MTKLEMIMKKKYRAVTARSRRERVGAPWYLEILRMMIGRRKPKSAETTDGRIPETMENFVQDLVNRFINHNF